MKNFVAIACAGFLGCGASNVPQRNDEGKCPTIEYGAYTASYEEWRSSCYQDSPGTETVFISKDDGMSFLIKDKVVNQKTCSVDVSAESNGNTIQGTYQFLDKDEFTFKGNVKQAGCSVEVKIHFYKE